MKTLQLLMDYASTTENIFLLNQLNKLKKEYEQDTKTLR